MMQASLSRSKGALGEVSGAHHLGLDVRSETLILEDLPDVIHGLAYCPGTIVLKPFQRLSIEDFLEDYQVNLLGAVKVIHRNSPGNGQVGGASALG